MSARSATWILLTLLFSFTISQAGGDPPGGSWLAGLEELLAGKISRQHEVAYRKTVEGGVTSYRTYLLHKEKVLDHTHIAGAWASIAPGMERLELWLRLTPEGAAIFERATALHVHERMAILFDGEVQSAHIIRAPIQGDTILVSHCVHSDRREMEVQVSAKAAAIDSGKVDVEIRLVDDRSDTIHKLKNHLPDGIRMDTYTYAVPGGKPVTEAYLVSDGQVKEGKHRLQDYLSNAPRIRSYLKAKKVDPKLIDDVVNQVRAGLDDAAREIILRRLKSGT